MVKTSQYHKGAVVVFVGNLENEFMASPINFLEACHSMPEIGKKYTVREFRGDSILLEEVINPKMQMDMGGIPMMVEYAFDVRKFAPKESVNSLLQKALSMNLLEKSFNFN